ncbi:MAG: isoleucine--tRNA ligase [Caulobacterales bacterium]|nr:isoleucine--tRNA ligase [Caulobacterales bacterium]MCA0373711.1 isoleucine--tRNA ligase [Pseudomonadota bacterium]
MTETTQKRDYKKTIFLPDTAFPMRAGLPQKEAEIIGRWGSTTEYKKIREASKSRPKWVLHDGPPYANGAMHIGHALNNILKDFMIRSKQMAGFDVDYIPGWDCHGLPIEWKVEEEFRAKGRDKKEISAVEFRKACREYAKKWVEVQKLDRIRMGVIGDWDNPYLTMNYNAEAVIEREFLNVVKNELVFRGSKPIMWSPVERTSLAEAEVEYQEKVSPAIWVKFPVVSGGPEGAFVIIWTTTPWTIPANRAISYSPKIAYGLYSIDDIEEGLEFTPFATIGDKIIVADALAEGIFASAKIAKYTRLQDVNPDGIICAHPLKNWADANGGYQFNVPMLAGDHVTDDAGTGFVHTAPSHGADDYLVWMKSGLPQSEIPFTVDEEGRLTKEAPGFEGALVMRIEGNAKDIGKEGDANPRVLDALKATGNLLAMGRLKHQYPHSWRSKAPIIFRNTPQWFIAMDRPVDALNGETLRQVALREINKTDWGGDSHKARIETMVKDRPDWLISRQRAWGVPLALFVHKETNEVLKDEEVNNRIICAMEKEGADAWYARPASDFLGPKYDANDYEQVHDILDVWFDSGSTHAFTLETRDTLPRPADMYLEGTDQHRGWFQSSLLECCATRGVAPYKAVRTHGFTVDDKGRKMSKSLGNGMEPQDIAKSNGIEILRVLFAAADYTQELALGKTMIDQASETYRKLRNTIRYMLASIKDFKPENKVAFKDLPFLEQWVFARAAEVDKEVRAAYADFDFKRALSAIADFANLDLSAFYVDVRKDTLYCDPLNSKKRRAAQSVLSELFGRFLGWLAPICPFTTEEAWLTLYPELPSIHHQTWQDIPSEWSNDATLSRMEKLRALRKAITGALELKRAAKEIGSSLEAAPKVYLNNAEIESALGDEDLAELCITSGIDLIKGDAPEGVFTLDDVKGVGVEFIRATGIKCARSWKYFDPSSANPNYPDITPRDAEAVIEWEKANGESI